MCLKSKTQLIPFMNPTSLRRHCLVPLPQKKASHPAAAAMAGGTTEQGTYYVYLVVLLELP